VDTIRIAALLEPFLDLPLTPVQLDQISIYIDLLLRWNARTNLTAVRDPESIVTRHFGESLFLARRLLSAPDFSGPLTTDHRPLTTVLDIGSGAGFPALPMKIWAPNIALTMIESNHKKAAFLREVSRALTLTDINVVAERAETLVDRLPPADLVTLRAVEKFETVVPLATRFLAPNGRLAFLIGSSQLKSLAALTPAISWLPLIPIPTSSSRVVAVSESST
jgi:16S rRNA (guanine527-N7)-methyltransferase